MNVANSPEASASRLQRALDGAAGLIRQHQAARARDVLQGILDGAGNGAWQLTAQHLDWIGTLLFHLGDPPAAEPLLRHAADRSGNPAIVFNHAAVLRALGRLEEAETRYDQVLALNPHDDEAVFNRSELRRQSHEHNHVEELRARLAADPADRGAIRIGFALGKELEDLEQYAQAFEAYRAANTRMRATLRYRPAADLELLDSLRRIDPPPVPSGTAGNDGEIFVFGLPRTGTTLVERILASHPGVRSVGESPGFPLAMERLQQAAGLPRTAEPDERVARMYQLDAVRLGAHYREALKAGHDNGPGRTVDKLPLNYLHAGLIRAALPGATLVLLERDPLDTVVALWRTLFRRAYPFSYDLNEMADYLIGYQRLMDHWRARLDLHVVRYETLTRDPRPTIEALLAACRLPWDEACLHPQRLAAPSTTASAVQIRSPIHSASVGQWRRHAGPLAPIAERFEAAGLRDRPPAPVSPRHSSR